MPRSAVQNLFDRPRISAGYEPPQHHFRRKSDGVCGQDCLHRRDETLPQAVVTVSSDSFDFLAPIKTGEAINLEAYVTWTHRTSMEVFVKVESENLLTGTKQMTARAYLTMIALDDQGKPTLVPSVIPETEEEKLQHEKAKERYELRRKRKAEV